MSRSNFNAICDICGFKYHRNEMQLNWKNQLVCMTDFEEKHPQLTLHSHRDRQSVRDARPRQSSPGLLNPSITPSQMV